MIYIYNLYGICNINISIYNKHIIDNIYNIYNTYIYIHIIHIYIIYLPPFTNHLKITQFCSKQKSITIFLYKVCP